MISALTSLVRLGHAGFIFAREGVFGVIDPVAIPPSMRPLIRMVRLIERQSSGAAETRLSTALTRLGPSYVKLGQFLATRPDVVGDAESYRYLVESIRNFPKPQAFAGMMRAAGFARVSHRLMSGGIVALHSGWRL